MLKIGLEQEFFARHNTVPDNVNTHTKIYGLGWVNPRPTYSNALICAMVERKLVGMGVS